MSQQPASLLTAYHRSKKPRSESRSEQAYRSIKRGIIRMEYAPASLLNELELKEVLGIGRTPIREALQRLALENFVVILPRRGTMVADLNLSDMQKISELRLELEGFAARLASERARPEHLSTFDEVLLSIECISDSDDHHKLIELDQRFHQLVAQASGNEFLAGELVGLYDQVIRHWYHALHKVVKPLGASLADHNRVADAIRARDGTLAAQVIREHITRFQIEFQAVL